MSYAGVSYWAILIAAVVGWLAGAAWYMSLGKFWQAAAGITPEKMQENRAKPLAWLPFVYAFAANLVMAWTLAGIMSHIGPVTVRSGLLTAAHCWFGFILATILLNNAFAMRPFRLTLIDSGHYLVVLLLAGAIIGAIGV